MLHFLKRFFRLLRFHKPRNRQATPPNHLRNARGDSSASETPVTADIEARLSQRYFHLAQNLRQKFPQACVWLEPEDLDVDEEGPVRSGGYADIWKARLDGRAVAIKSYRRYVNFDCDGVRMVSYRHGPAKQ